MKNSQQQQLVKLYRKALNSGVSMEEFNQKLERRMAGLKASVEIEAEEDLIREEKNRKSVPTFIMWGSILVPLIFIGVGLYLVGSAVVPILAYYVNTAPELEKNRLIAPVPPQDVVEITPLVITQSGLSDDSTSKQPIIIDEELDYTNLVNWFGNNSPELAALETEAQPTIEYVVDIPKLKIEDAKVAIGGTDLNKSLIAYPGTAMPGELGAPVIFGHSVLRQYYNPSVKNPRRYNSIFSTIMTLESGDEIIVTVGDTEYKYVVQTKTEVKPTDVYILNQQFDARRLKLVTCTPEGTYLRRGVVTAQLVE